jgi:hypothetical protein
MRSRLALAALAALACLPGSAPPSRAQTDPAAGPVTASAPAPHAALALTGPAVEVGGRLLAAPGVRVEPRLGGSAEAVARWQAAVGGAGAALPTSWPPGEHTVAGTVFDLGGNAVEAAPLAFTVDAAPPAVRWEVRDPGIFEARGEPSAAARDRGRRRDRRDKAAAADLAWSADGRRWLPLPWHGEPGEDGAIGSFEVVSDRPQVFLKSTGPEIEADGKALAPGGDRVLWIEAQDEGVGVARLAVRTRPAADGDGAVLEVEAVDLVGNAARLSWKVAR